MIKPSYARRMFVASLALLTTFVVPVFAAKPLPARIGDLVATPSAFDGKLVTVTAYVRTGRHFRVLMDQVDSDQGGLLSRYRRLRAVMLL
jgi:hypothetical protein